MRMSDRALVFDSNEAATYAPWLHIRVRPSRGPSSSTHRQPSVRIRIRSRGVSPGLRGGRTSRCRLHGHIDHPGTGLGITVIADLPYDGGWKEGGVALTERERGVGGHGLRFSGDGHTG